MFYGDGRDAYDVRGRVAHESVFNTNDGNFRCPNSQQGYSPFSTWTRGLAWAMCGFAEQLEFLATLPDSEFEPFGGRSEIVAMMRRPLRRLPATSTSRTRLRTGFLIGIPARPGWQGSATGGLHRPIHTTITSRSIARRPRLPRRVFCDWADYLRERAIQAGGSDDRRYSVR